MIACCVAVGLDCAIDLDELDGVLEELPGLDCATDLDELDSVLEEGPGGALVPVTTAGFSSFAPHPVKASSAAAVSDSQILFIAYSLLNVD